MPTFKLPTLGCKVNQYETQAIREQLLGSGFSEGNGKFSAEVYIINTCTVTQKADAESLNLIRRAIRENPKAQIFVTGCLTELDAPRIKKLHSKIRIIKNRHKDDIAQHILGGNQKPAAIPGISYFKGHSRAFLKIQDGCNNRCSYCKVPLVRGASRSRVPEIIIKEAGRIVASDFKEIVLCGICLGAYGRDLKPATNLTKLLQGLEELGGLERIRLSSIEAGDISDSLIDKIAQSPKICRHLHIPIQSGDDAILKKMGRSYSRKYYLGLIQKLQNRIPGIAITTDVLVGFPGEGRDNFKNTLSLVQRIMPLKAHIFPYSRREGTPACNFENSLSAQEARARLHKLRHIASGCSLEYRSRFLNKKMDVLFENRLPEKSNLWQGYADNYIKVIVEASRNLINQILTVKFKEIGRDYVRADLC